MADQDSGGKKTIRFKLTARQANLVWGIIDGAMDAGACEGGLTAAENEACSVVANALLRAGRVPAPLKEE